MKRLASAIVFAAIVAAPLAAQQPLTLDEAIAIAQQHGHPSQIARLTRNAAQFRDNAFGARLLPQLSLGGSLPRYNQSIIPVLQPDGSTLFQRQQQTDANLSMTMTQKLPVIGGDLFVSSSLERFRVTGSSTFETWSSSPLLIGLRQDIFRPNALAWDRREENALVERNDRAYLATMEDIAAQTTDLFFNVYAARVGLANAIANAAVNDTLYRINTGRFGVGRIGENDLLQSELALLQKRGALDAARLELNRATEALRLGLGLSGNAPLDVTVLHTVPTYEPDTTRAVEEAMRNGQAVSDVHLADVQARRRVTEAKLQGGAGATVQASYGFNATGAQAGLAYQNLLEARQFSLSVQVPIWQFGAHSNTVHAAEADRERNDAQAENTMEQVAFDAKFSALQLTEARHNLDILERADSVAGKRYDVAYNRYVIGRITIENLYIAQAEKDQALTQYAEGLRRYWQAHYHLRRITLFDFAAGHPIR